MIALALETTGDRAAVAVQGHDRPVREAFVEGARRHAGALLPLAVELLAAEGARLADVQRIVLADGPGSFTGLRVGASVLKALVAATGAEAWRASTLLARAWAHRPAAGGEVVVVTSALRAEGFVARYAIGAGGDIATVRAPHVLLLADVGAFAAGAAVVVADLPGEAAGLAGLAVPPGAAIIGRPASAPRAAPLLALVGREGGADRLHHPDDWEPEYGRPAEAQARWELAHGRTLPHSAGHAQ